MADLIILVYGKSRKLVQKPADYKSLIDATRDKFPELLHAADDEIAFHFTPKWFDREVELDDGSFADVYARAVLRITTATATLAQHAGNEDVNLEYNGIVGPMPPLSGDLPPLGWMKMRVTCGRCITIPKTLSAVAYTDGSSSYWPKGLLPHPALHVHG